MKDSHFKSAGRSTNRGTRSTRSSTFANFAAANLQAFDLNTSRGTNRGGDSFANRSGNCFTSRGDRFASGNRSTSLMAFFELPGFEMASLFDTNRGSDSFANRSGNGFASRSNRFTGRDNRSTSRGANLMAFFELPGFEMAGLFGTNRGTNRFAGRSGYYRLTSGSNRFTGSNRSTSRGTGLTAFAKFPGFKMTKFRTTNRRTINNGVTRTNGGTFHRATRSGMMATRLNITGINRDYDHGNH